MRRRLDTVQDTRKIFAFIGRPKTVQVTKPLDCGQLVVVSVFAEFRPSRHDNHGLTQFRGGNYGPHACMRNDRVALLQFVAKRFGRNGSCGHRAKSRGQ